MYLFFLLEQQGYPVNEVYENTIKHVPTDRFHEYLKHKEEKEKEECETPRGGTVDELPSEFPFDPDASYEDLPRAEITIPERPSIVPELGFEGIPAYETSSDEEEDETED